MTHTYEALQNMTQDERFEVAREAYRSLQAGEPALEARPGDMAAKIVENTGVDFETAAIVALSAAIGR